VVPAVRPDAPFGWANLFAAQADVVMTGGQYRMYFTGQSLGSRISLGVATSTDGGHSFTPQPAPIFKPADNTFYDVQTEAPSVFSGPHGPALAFSATDLMAPMMSQIGLATSVDGLQPFTIANGGKPILKRAAPRQTADCDYCQDGIDYPMVIDDPTNGAVDGGIGGKLMFFAATSQGHLASIGRASSSDGVTFVPEPAPVLSGDIGGEAVLVSPQVMIDGTVFKMWYSFVGLADFRLGAFCDLTIAIGYATSSDGFYWVRSPANVKGKESWTHPGGWDDGIKTFLANTPVPLDGSNPSSGVALYYTTVRHAIANDFTSPCVPNGIGRATRP
jgi:hypothetical protein